MLALDLGLLGGGRGFLATLLGLGDELDEVALHVRERRLGRRRRLVDARSLLGDGVAELLEPALLGFEGGSLAVGVFELGPQLVADVDVGAHRHRRVARATLHLAGQASPGRAGW